MPTPDDDRIGARIRTQRKRAHLTQRELALRAGYSYSLVNQVECGARQPTDSFLRAIATALRVDASMLTGPADVTETRQQAARAAMVRPIRDALDLWDLDLAGHPSDTEADLIAAANAVCQEVRAAHLRSASHRLPGLIFSLTLATQTAPTTETWQALASVYRTAHDITLKLGYPDLSTVALDRMGWAAERASDPCLAAIRYYKRALTRKESDAGISVRLINAGCQLLDGKMSREALAVLGQLHLGGAAVEARAGNEASVATHLAAASELADRVGGEAPEVHWLSFGHVNAKLHAMGAAMTLRHYDDALLRARGIRLPSGTVTSRRARYLVDRAVVELETGHTDVALRHLVEARRAAPEQTRYLPNTRVAVTGLLHVARRTPDSLTHMATWVGV